MICTRKVDICDVDCCGGEYKSYSLRCAMGRCVVFSFLMVILSDLPFTTVNVLNGRRSKMK